MNNLFMYRFTSLDKTGKEHTVTFTPIDDNWWTVQISDLGVDVTQFFEDEDFNDVSYEYAQMYNLGVITKRERDAI